jgi:hypothetical protein
MTALHTLIRRLDMFLQGNESTGTTKEVTQNVTLKLGAWNQLYTYGDLEKLTGGSKLYPARQMPVTIKYKIDNVNKEMEIINVTYPNGKTSIHKSSPTTQQKQLWYTLSTESKDIELPYFDSDAFYITPTNGEDETRISFVPPK